MCISFPYHYSEIKINGQSKSFQMKDINLHKSYWNNSKPGCWWTGDARNQGISSHDIDIHLRQFSIFGTKRVKYRRCVYQYNLLFYCRIWTDEPLWPCAGQFGSICNDFTLPWRHPRLQSSWGQHGAHLGPVGPRWAPCWPHEPCYQGYFQ